MSSGHVNWWHVVLGGAAAFAVCTAVGWWYDADNLKKKKKPQRGQGGGMAQQMFSEEVQKLDQLLTNGEAAIKKKSYKDAETMFEQALDVLENSTEDHRDILLPFCTRRLATIAEHNHDNAAFEKYMLRTVECYESRPDLSAQEQSEFGELLDKLIEFYNNKVHTPQKAERPLLLLLDLSERNHNEVHAMICRNLLGTIAKEKKQLEEAEKYYSKVLDHYTDKVPKDDLFVTTCISLIEVLYELGGDERLSRAKQLYLAVAGIVQQSLPPARAIPALATIGEGAYDKGFFEEAQKMLHMAVQLARMHNVCSKEDLCHIENSVLAVKGENGLDDEVKAGFATLKNELAGARPPLTFSRFLKTDAAVVSISPAPPEPGSDAPLKADIKFVVVVERREARPLPTGTHLVFQFENPAEGADPIEVTRDIKEGEEKINVSAPIPFARAGYYTLRVDIYKDAEKKEKLGTHYQLVQSLVDTDTLTPEQILARSGITLG